MDDPDTFDISDLERVVTDEARLLMAETILAWADLDTGISYYTLLIFGLESDAGSILIGNMDLKTKIERVKMLYDHRGFDPAAKSLSSLITSMRDFSSCRNAVAHRKCVGRLKSDPERLVFMSAKHIKRVPGKFEMVSIHQSELIASAEFARSAAVKMHELITAAEES